MDLTELAFKVGEVHEDQREIKSMLKTHIAKQDQIDGRLVEVESFNKRQKIIAGFVTSMGAALLSFLPFRK